jgi:integrase
MKYLFWRGQSLYCRYPIPSKPESYPLGIYSTGTPLDRQRCLRSGEQAISEIRVFLAQGKPFEIKEGGIFEIKEMPKEEPKKYRPKYGRLVGRYWYFHLRFTKSAESERYHLIHSLRKFGQEYADEIYREDVELWLNEMKGRGDSINAINNRFSYLRATYRYANGENNPKWIFNYNPLRSLKSLPGANIRTFVLTKEKFERNYEFLIKRNPRFALFYLALWETGRRPWEASQYCWEMIREVMINGERVHILSIPPMIAKMDDFDTLPISPRLWSEISQLGYRHGLIFRNEDGQRWLQWSCHKASLEKAFGADCGWIRDCRRGMVTHKTEIEGCDPLHVRAVSGHRSNSVFERYRIGNIKNILKVINPPTNGEQSGDLPLKIG